MIEHSPVGALPHTPTYQDALRHLLASHQVYASADHKNGYVTVRSLAAAPSFLANNLEAVLAGKTEAAKLEPDASIFSRYVQSLPEALRAKAESHRAALVARRTHHRAKHGDDAVQDPVHTLFFVSGTGMHPALPGNYLYGSLLQTGADMQSGPWSVHVHDSEEGTAMCDVSSAGAALEKVEEVVASAPFQLTELAALGFRLT